MITPVAAAALAWLDRLAALPSAPAHIHALALQGYHDALEHRDQQRSADAARVDRLAEQVAAVVGDHDPDRPLAELIVALAHVLDITAPTRQEAS